MYIYKTTNNVNGKIYVGKLVRESKTYLGSGKLLKLSINKYGKENFTKEIIEYCNTKSELSEREIYWIEKFDSTNKDIGYNITKGGDGGSTNGYFLGKSLTLEHRLKISQNHHDVSGPNNPMFGKKHSKFSKMKISINSIGRSHSKDTIEKLKLKSKGENNSNSKLTEMLVKQIRTDFDSGISLTKLSVKYGVKKACVWKIIKRISWKHI
jgi:group I intron endonuclease